MFCSSKTNSSMATLLQQKNCMTALTNGTVSGSGSTSNATNNSGTDEKSTILTGHHHHNHHHDIVTIPSSADIVVNSVISSGSVSGGGGGGGGYGGIISSNSVNDNFGSILSSATTTAGDNFSYFITQSLPATTTNSIIGHNTNNSQQHQQQQQQHHQIQNSSTFQNFDIISNNHHQSNNHIQSYSNTTRYFSQFSNQETDFLYNMPTTSSSSSSDSNNRHMSGPISSSSSFGLNANTNANNGTLVSLTTTAASVTTAASHSTNYPAIKQEPPNTTSLSSSSLTASRNLNASNRIDGTKELSNNPISNSREQKIEIDDDQKPILTANTDGENVAQQQQQHEHEQQQQNNAEQEQESEPEIDIVINNVVCSFSVRCHLNLREIALNGFNVEFRRENGMVTMKLRRPYTTASIWSSGRITCTGATSEEQAKIAARRYARCLQKLGFSVRFHNFRVVNVLGTCSMPWAIKIVNFSEKYKKDASYEPELHPGVTYKLKYPKATLKIFSTGSITVTAGSVAHVQAAIEHIFPLVYEFRKKRTPEEMELLRAKHNPVIEDAVVVNDDDEILHTIPTKKRKRPPGCADNDPNEDIMYVSDYEMDEQDPDDPQ